MAIANLSTLTETDFYAKFRSLIGQIEGNEQLPYYDTTGNPTIGIGFNIYGNTSSMRNSVFDAINVPNGPTDTIRTRLSNIINDASRRTRAIAAATAKDWTTLNAINTEMQSALDAAYGKPFSMTADQINTLFDAEAKSRVDSVKTSSGVGFSMELVALVSAEFNGVYGSGLRDALAMSDPHEARAEAWNRGTQTLFLDYCG